MRRGRKDRAWEDTYLHIWIEIEVEGKSEIVLALILDVTDKVLIRVTTLEVLELQVTH